MAEKHRDLIGHRLDPIPQPKPQAVRRNPEPEKFCKECSKPVPPNRTIDGSPGRGSIDLMFIDPDRLFCTLRCAARFGVAAWNKYRRAA